MKNNSFFFALLLISFAFVVCSAQGTLPTLYKIQRHTFPKPYSCGSYSDGSLFLSDYSQSRNSPDLLYASCVSCSSSCTNTFATSTVVWDFGAVAALPNVQNLTELSASSVMNYDWGTGNAWTTSGWTAVKSDQIYAVILAKPSIRGMFAFRVVDYTFNGPLTIEYGVFDYEIQITKAQSPGSQWQQHLNN